MPAEVSLWMETLGLSLRQRHVSAGGLRTRVLEAGEGPPLVLLHGTGGHAEAYARNLRALGEGFRVVAFDLLGHGFTDKPAGPYTLDDYAEHLGHVLDELGIGRANLSGESLGAWVAAWFAAGNPDRVERLLLNTPGNVTNKVEVMEMIRDSTRAAVRNPTRETVRARLEWLFAPVNRGLISEELVSIRHAIYSQPGYAEAVEGVLALQDPEIRACFSWSAEWCGRIQAPTLVLWTSDDPTGAEEEGHLLVRWIPDSHLEVIDQAGHWPQWEKPSEFNQIVRRFFAVADVGTRGA